MNQGMIVEILNKKHHLTGKTPSQVSIPYYKSIWLSISITLSQFGIMSDFFPAIARGTTEAISLKTGDYFAVSSSLLDPILHTGDRS